MKKQNTLITIRKLGCGLEMQKHSAKSERVGSYVTWLDAERDLLGGYEHIYSPIRHRHRNTDIYREIQIKRYQKHSHRTGTANY